MKVELHKRYRFLAFTFDDGWAFGAPVVVLEPVVRVFENDERLDSALEDVAILATVSGEMADHPESVERRGWSLDELRATAEEALASGDRGHAMEVFVEFYIEFDRDGTGLMASRIV